MEERLAGDATLLPVVGALAFAIAFVYAQVTVNDFVIARYTAEKKAVSIALLGNAADILPELLPKLVETDPRGMGKICPPMIMGNLLELLPLDQRGAAGNDDIFFLKVFFGTENARESDCEKQDQR